MSFGGGGSQGVIRYALIVDDAQATQKLNTFKTNLTGLATPTANINRNLAQMGTTLKTNSASITQSTTQINQLGAAQKAFNASTLTTGKNVATMGNQFKATANSIKSAGPPLANLEKTSVSLGTKVKDAGTKFGGLAVGLSATTSSALQLAAGFRDYSDAQIAVERVTRRLSLGQEALGKAQAKLNELQKSGKASSAELAQAQLDVTQAQKQVEIQTQLVGEAQERMFDSQSQFVVSIVPTVLGAFGTMSMAVKDFGLKMTDLKKIGPAVISAMTSIAGSFTTTGAAATTASVGVKALSASLLTVGGPLVALAAAAIAVYQGTKTMYDAIRILDQGISSHAGNVSALEMLYGRMRIALGKASEEEKKAFYQMEADQDKIVKGLEKVEIPPWERIFGLSPETQKKLADAAALIEKELNPALKDNAKAATEIAPATIAAAKGTGTLTDEQLRLLPVEEQLAIAREKNTAAHALENKMLEEGIQKAGDASAAIFELDVALIREHAGMNATKEGIDEVLESMIPLIDRTEEEYEQQQKLNKAWADAHQESLKLNQSLLDEAKSLGATNEQLDKYTPKVGATDEEIKTLNYSLDAQRLLFAQQANDLMLGENYWSSYNDALVAGTVSAGEFIKQMEFGEVATDAWLREVNEFYPGIDKLATSFGLTNAQIQQFIIDTRDGKNAVAEFNKEWEAAVKIFEEKPLLMKEFKIEADPEEFIDDFVDRLSKSERKKVKMKLKIEQAAEDAKAAIDDIFALYTNLGNNKTIVWDGEMVTSDKSAKKFGDNLIKTIDEQFGGHKNVPEEWKNFQKQIEDASEGSDPMAGIIAALNSPEAQKLLEQNPIPVKIVADERSVSDTQENVQDFMNENPIDVPAVPKFTTPEQNKSIWQRSAEIMKLFEGLEAPVSAKVDDVVIGNGVDPAQAAFDANPYSATIDTIQFSPKMGMNPAEGAAAGEAIRGVIQQAISSGNLDKARNMIWDYLMMGPQKRAQADLTRNQTGGANWLAGLGKGPNPTGGANWLAGQGMGPKPEEMVLKVNNTQAIKAIDVVAKRIVSLSTIQAMIKLINTTAIKATDVVAKRIFSLTGLQPSISLQNKKAIKANDVVANRIDSLTKIKPSISLQNNKAIKAVDVVAKRINDLGNISPTVNVKVNYTGIRSFQHGGTFMTQGPELIMVGDNPGGRERVSVAPTSTGASAGGHGTLVVHLHNINSDRETVRTFRREIGKEIFRFGPT